MTGSHQNCLLEEIVRPSRADAGITFVDFNSECWHSYADLRAQAATVAGVLRRRGVEEGDAVAIALENSAPSVIALLGIWMAGATVVSIPPPWHGSAAGAYAEAFAPVLRRLDTKIVVSGAGPERALRSSEWVCVSPESLVDASGSSDRDPEGALPRTALMQFTSGSTGAPRGVSIVCDVLAGHLQVIAEALEVDDGDVACSWLPLHHDMGLVGMFLTALHVRAPLTLMTPRAFVRNPIKWLTRCAESATTVTGAPTFAYRLAGLAMANGMDPGDLSCIRAALVGAERVSYSAMTDFLEAARPYGLSSTAIMPVYGLAEGTLAVAFPRLGEELREGPLDTVSVGQPLPGVAWRATNVDSSGRGTLDIRGDWMLDSYETAAGRVDPFSEDGWFATSDIVSTDEQGNLFVYGRADEVLVVNGRNVYAEDVEAAMQDLVRDALGFFAAYRVSDREFAVVGEWLGLSSATPEDTAKAIHEVVTSTLGTRLSSVMICKPRTLPLTTSGKVKRSVCRDRTHDGDWSADAILAVT